MSRTLDDDVDDCRDADSRSNNDDDDAERGSANSDVGNVSSPSIDEFDPFRGFVVNQSCLRPSPTRDLSSPDRRPLRCVFQLAGRRANVVEMLAVRAINGTPAVACASATAAAVESLTTRPISYRSATVPDDANSTDTRLLHARRQAVADLAEAGGLPEPAPPTGSRLPGYRRRFKPNIGYRLGRRRQVTERRKLLCDYSLVFAALGLVIMIVETELSMANVYEKVRFAYNVYF